MDSCCCFLEFHGECYLLYAVVGYSVLSSALVLILSLALIRYCYAYIKIKRGLQHHQRGSREDVQPQEMEAQENVIAESDTKAIKTDDLIPLDPMYDVVTSDEQNQTRTPASAPPPAPPPPPIPAVQPVAVYAVINKKKKDKASPGHQLSPVPLDSANDTMYNKLIRSDLKSQTIDTDTNAVYDRLENEPEIQLLPEPQYDVLQS